MHPFAVTRHTELHRPDHLFDNGCALCLAEQGLLAAANGTAVYPPWSNTPERQDMCDLEDIRYILRAHKIPTTAERLRNLKELGL